MLKKAFNVKTLVRLVFFSFVISAVYVAVRVVTAPTVAPDSDISIRIKSDYVLMLVQCIGGILAMLLPGFLWNRIHLSIPSYMVVTYAIFLYCAIYLGEVREFYYRIPHWDTILHTTSGAMLGALGLSLIGILNNSDRVPVILSPAFVCLFAFCFAVSLGALWEIYEFLVDVILDTNMQRYNVLYGPPHVGQEALMDTMKDLIVDTSGALVMSVIGYFSLKREKNWLERIQLKKAAK